MGIDRKRSRVIGSDDEYRKLWAVIGSEAEGQEAVGSDRKRWVVISSGGQG